MLLLYSERFHDFLIVVIKEKHAHLWLTNIAVRYNNLQYNVIAVMWMRNTTGSEDDRTLHDQRMTAWMTESGHGQRLTARMTESGHDLRLTARMTEPGHDLSRHNKL